MTGITSVLEINSSTLTVFDSQATKPCLPRLLLQATIAKVLALPELLTVTKYGTNSTAAKHPWWLPGYREPCTAEIGLCSKLKGKQLLGHRKWVDKNHQKIKKCGFTPKDYLTWGWLHILFAKWLGQNLPWSVETLKLHLNCTHKLIQNTGVIPAYTTKWAGKTVKTHRKFTVRTWQ